MNVRNVRFYFLVFTSRYNVLINREHLVFAHLHIKYFGLFRSSEILKLASGLFSDLFEGQPALWILNEDFIHLVLRDAPRQHLWHDVLQDVRVAVTAVLGQTVPGVDVMCDHYLVLVALLHQERQAEHEQTTC